MLIYPVTDSPHQIVDVDECAHDPHRLRLILAAQLAGFAPEPTPVLQIERHFNQPGLDLPWNLEEPDLSATLSSDGRMLYYSTNAGDIDARSAPIDSPTRTLFQMLIRSSARTQERSNLLLPDRFPTRPPPHQERRRP